MANGDHQTPPYHYVKGARTMKKTFYITTPIYYPSANAHVGHSYTTVVCDTMARLKRMQGFDVMFLTGTDEHGQKIETSAKATGKTPKEYVDEIVAGFQRLWKRMDITYDRFIRTTDDYHIESVQKIFKTLYDKGEIYKSVYKGAYCKPCESFWTDSQLVDGKCPDCGRDVEQAEEEAYFFRLSSYGDRIMKLYEEHPEFLQPQARVNEMVNNFLKPGLEDLCVSRTSFTWGVPVDFDPGHVVYVWIDALSNYITALGYGNDRYNDFDKYWPADFHLMSKEIVRFHTIIWPSILMALELPLPKRVYSHGWLLFGGDKMSKSKGNVVDPYVLCDRYGVDAIRYFLLRDVPFGQDGNFTNEALIQRINSDLANDLGNLVSRTVAMVEKYFGGTLPTDRQPGDFDDDLIAQISGLYDRVNTLAEDLQFPTALTEIFRVIARTNKYIDETTPWVLAKDEANNARLATVMYNLLEAIRVLGVLLSPFLPETAPKIFAQIGAAEAVTTWESANTFGMLPQNVTVKKGDALFPRIDMEKELAELEALGAAKAAPKAEEKPVKAEVEGVASLIDIDDFAKVELRVAEIVACEPVPKADKLLKIQLDDGAGGRQVVSGIHTWYEPADLIGKKIILVANLKPAKLRGVESQGMLLAADAGDAVKVIFADLQIPAGSKVR
ncbi:methionine--tRNA ligase [Ruminococcaceae bacterium OttesenSCG-928-L11]|nr:methionine--tRNA ligase [Ruminococcaceae bacterium OttesenSCG-928-L11]